MEDKKQPIVIKKINQAHGHHGGSWKVAFADFATAMMAFFMVLWLVGQTDAKKRGGIAEYFQNPSMVKGRSEAPTGSIGPGGASTSLIQMGGTMELQRQLPVEIEKVKDEEIKKKVTKIQIIEDAKRLDSLLEELKDSIGKTQALKPFKDQLLLDITPEGLRIQIVDKENRSMFASGSAELQPYTVDILFELAKVINNVPNHVSISGHTDAVPFSIKGGTYTNWELSADRANAARRALIAGGIKPNKIAKVIGLGSTVLFNKAEPNSPINRRISIVIMNRETSDYGEDGKKKPGQPDIKKDAQKTENLEGVRKPVIKPKVESTVIQRVTSPSMEGEANLTGIKGLNKYKREMREKAKNGKNRNMVIRSKIDVNNTAPVINLPPIIDPSLLPSRNGQNTK